VALLGDALVSEIHAARMPPRQFRHLLTDLTVAVHPQAQERDIGSRLFAALFETGVRLTPSVTGIEVIARSGNAAAIRLYERLGFRAEGRSAAAFASRTVASRTTFRWPRFAAPEGGSVLSVEAAAPLGSRPPPCASRS
jgi:ribosomal protein S18 acetylase RimI-like enzyme